MILQYDSLMLPERRADPVTFGNRERNILKKHGRSKRLRNSLCIDDRCQRLLTCFRFSCGKDLVDPVGFEPRPPSSFPYAKYIVRTTSAAERHEEVVFSPSGDFPQYQ